MRIKDSPHYADWRQAVIEVAQTQWALNDGHASQIDVDRAAARYDRMAELLHEGQNWR